MFVFVLLCCILSLTGCAGIAGQQGAGDGLPGEKTPPAYVSEESLNPEEEPAKEELPEASEEMRSDEDPGRSGTSFETDYALLWEELRNSYPYLPYLEELGIDTESVYEGYREDAASAESEGAFAGLLQRMFSELGNFAHLDLVTPEMYRTYCSIYLNTRNGMPGGLAEPYVRILQDPGLSKSYSRSGPVQESRETPAGGRSGEVIIHYFGLHYYEDCKALYLMIPSFAQENIERDRSLIEDALRDYPETKNIIFDITGNSGGSDYYWMENLVAPFGGRYEYTYRNFFRSSGIYERYYPDLESLPVSELEDAPEWVGRLGLDRYYVSRLVFPGGGGEQPPRHSGIKRWVLTGSQVYSSSEKFACFCKATRWATLVGTKTSGDGLGTTPVLILLPHSGLLVRFSYFAGENPDGSMNAARGTRPDVPSVKGGLPLNRCLERIREENEAERERSRRVRLYRTEKELPY